MNMQGKKALITGANSGVGYATAINLAGQGAHIIMICRNPDKGEQARQRIAAASTNGPPELILADLSSQAEIRGLAVELKSRHERIDLLINNAGGVFAKREQSIDGIEMTLATNHLAPFLLTNLTLDLLRAAPAARIVTVASEIYARKLDFANLQGERSYQFFKAYQRSKLCNVLFAYELARRINGTNITSNVVSPGPSKTGFGENMTGAPGVFARTMKRTPRFGTAENGAKTVIYAATAPELAQTTGKFFYKSKELTTKPLTHDETVSSKLWQVSNELCAATVSKLDEVHAR